VVERKVPIVIVKVAEVVGGPLDLFPRAPGDAEGRVHLGTLALEPHPEALRPRRVALGFARSNESARDGVEVRVEEHVVFQEEHLVRIAEIGGDRGSVPDSVHHPPPVVLQACRPRTTLAAVLVLVRPAPESGIVSREHVGVVLARVRVKDLLHSNEIHFLNCVHDFLVVSVM